MMRGLILAALLAGGVPMAAQAQAAPAATQPDAAIEHFMQTVQSGKVREALLGLASNSPLLVKNLGDAATLTAQVQQAITMYGPVIGWERIETKPLGTMIRRETYIVQHRDMVTRWRFMFVRTNTGWIAASFNFDDSLPTWFE
jgi:hypothetical protein